MTLFYHYLKVKRILYFAMWSRSTLSGTLVQLFRWVICTYVNMNDATLES